MNTFVFEPKAEFAAMLKGSDENIDLIHAALCIAGEFNPKLDPEDSYRRLSKLVDRARVQIDTDQSTNDIATGLCHLLYHQIGFSGDNKDYYNPDNSYFNKVLETRRGIPISLALVYIGVGEALGLSIDGVGFPGHFLLKLRATKNDTSVSSDESGDVLIDPFAGQVLSPDDCQDFLAVTSGNKLSFKSEYLQTITKRAILRRMLGNLKAIYMNQSDYVQVLSLCNCLLLLDKNSIQDRLDRAGILEKLECYEPAARDLEQILTSKLTMKVEHALKQKITELRSKIEGKTH